MKLLKRLGAFVFAASVLTSVNVANAKVYTQGYGGYEIKVNTSNKMIKIKYGGSTKCAYKVGSLSAIGDAYSCAQKTGGIGLAKAMYDLAKKRLF